MIDAKTFARYASDPSAFRSDLLIDVSGSVRRFGDVMDPWQREDFAALDPGLMRCNGRGSDAAAKMRAYLERGRGSSKTTDIAVTCCWALAFAVRPIKGFAYAADRDQARLLRDAMLTLTRLNPWLADILSVDAHRVVNVAKGHPGEGGTLSVEASDVGSSFGILPDLLVADELCHWAGDGSLWHSLISSAAKRGNCFLFCISNAGMVQSWQWLVREAARIDPGWYFHTLDGPIASWLSKATLDEQRRMLPAVAWQRLWGNRWSSGGGDALTEADIDAAFVDGLLPMTGRDPNFHFVSGIDLGLTRDCSSVVTLAVPRGGTAGRIRLATARLWKPVVGRKIDLMEIERHVLELDERLGLESVGFDPWQAELLGQRLEADSDHRRRNQRRTYNSQPWVRECTPTATNLRQQASLVLECFADHRLQLYDYEPLRSDLRKLRVEERAGSGFRITCPRDENGHGDSYSAFANALTLAHELAGKKSTELRSMIDSGPVDEGAAWRQRQADHQRHMQEMWESHHGGDEYAEGFLNALRGHLDTNRLF